MPGFKVKTSARPDRNRMRVFATEVSVHSAICRAPAYAPSDMRCIILQLRRYDAAREGELEASELGGQVSDEGRGFER